MSEAVADTSVLIAFSGTDQLALLRGIFPKLLIPPAVVAELENGDWKEARRVLDQIRARTWIRVESPHSTELSIPPPAMIGAGELGVVRLAIQHNLPALIDEAPARRFAGQSGLVVTGSLGVLARAKREGLISAIRPIVEAMLNQGIRFKPELLRRFLEDMKEA